MTIENLRGNFTYAMHGCGAFRGILHSNSKEAYNHWKNKVKVFETDVVETEDSQFVLFASHGLTARDLKRLEIYNPVSSGLRTKEWLLNQKVFTRSSCGLSVMSLEYVMDEMLEDENLIFIFDLFGLWESTSSFAQQLVKLVRGRNLLNRIIVEVYYEIQIEALKDIDRRINIMYCVKEESLPRPNNIKMERLIELGVGSISYPWHYLDDSNDLKRYVQAGFIIMSLTKSNRKCKKLKELGVNINNVDIVYTIGSLGCQISMYLWGRLKWYVVKIYDRYITKMFKK